MASFEKINICGIGRILLHNNRVSEDGIKHTNEDIISEKTKYNYHIKKGGTKDIKKRIDELFVMEKKNTAIMGEIVVTLPDNVKEEDERDFFEAVYNFYCNDFEEKNIINAVVHKDEKKPHIHIDFIPVVKGEPQLTSPRGKIAIEKWKQKHNGEMPKERICCKELMTRKYLINMHPRLSDYIKKELGYEANILNGKTINGNKTVLKMKVEKMENDIKKLEQEKANLEKEINNFLNIARQNGISKNDIGLYPLVQEIYDIKKQNEILKNILTREGYKFRKSDLEALKKRIYIPAKSVKVNIKTGSLIDEKKIPDDAIIVIETYDKKPRPLPQEKLLEADARLDRQTRMFIQGINQVAIKPSRKNEQLYILIKTDSTQQTINNLLLLEQKIREEMLDERKLYMDKITNDTYDFAKSILLKMKIESVYFMREPKEEKQKENEEIKEKENI